MSLGDSASNPMLSRVLVKLSGEALAGEAGFGIDPATLKDTAAEVSAAASGVQLSLVVGGGTCFVVRRTPGSGQWVSTA